MKPFKRPITTLIFLLLAQMILISNQVHANSNQLEDPLFWINKIKNSDRLLLTPAEIEKMNEENLKRQDGPNGSLLHRLTEIQLIGPGSEVKK